MTNRPFIHTGRSASDSGVRRGLPYIPPREDATDALLEMRGMHPDNLAEDAWHTAWEHADRLAAYAPDGHPSPTLDLTENL